MRQVRGSLPVYLQLTETLVRDIAAGGWWTGRS